MKEINCNVRINQGCHLSPTLFHMYIDELEVFLEEVGCVDTKLIGLTITLLLYAYDVVLLERNPSNLENQLQILKDFCNKSTITMNTNKTKIMIIKSRNVTYPKFVYGNHNSK